MANRTSRYGGFVLALIVPIGEVESIRAPDVGLLGKAEALENSLPSLPCCNSPGQFSAGPQISNGDFPPEIASTVIGSLIRKSNRIPAVWAL